MALNAKKLPSTGGNRVEQPLLDPGSYPARVVQLIDLGLQPQRPYQGQEKQPQYEISITYELLDEFMVDEDGNVLEDKPRWISESMPFFSLNAERAKSTQRYLALDPKQDFEGDFSQLLGAPCLVTLVQNPGKGSNAGKTYINVASISSMRDKDAAKAPELVNDPKAFDLGDPDLEIFDSFPDFIKDKIKSNLEFEGSVLQELLGGSPSSGQVESEDDDSEEEDGDDLY